MTVFSLSVSADTGTPPIRRSVTSRHAISVGSVRSQAGSTTRNRDHASHAQNSNVARGVPSGPGTCGPLPQSHCSHSPGSDLLTELTMSR